jgi:hypothetical protein
MSVLRSLDPIVRVASRRPALAVVLAGAIALAVPSSVAAATPTPPPSPTKATACGVFTLADAQTLIGSKAKADPSQSHTVNLGGQRNTQCAYAVGASGLAEVQMLIPLNAQQAQQLKTAFAGNQRSYQGTSVKGIGAEAFWKSKVGTPAIYVLTASDVMFNLGATTNGTNSASQAKLEQVAAKIIKVLG